MRPQPFTSSPVASSHSHSITQQSPNVDSQTINQTKPTTDIFSILPFFNLTNIELFNTLETVESYIKTCLQDMSFPKHLQSTLPDSSILKQTCKYYTTEQFYTLNKKITNLDTKLLHLNIRSLDAHYGELLAFHESVGGDFDFIALTEIGPKNLESRRAMLNKIDYDFVFDQPTTTKGGAGLIYKVSINLVERNDLKLHSILNL